MSHCWMFTQQWYCFEVINPWLKSHVAVAVWMKVRTLSHLSPSREVCLSSCAILRG